AVSYVGHMTVMGTGVIPQWTVPDKIRKAREYAGLSQQELADRLSVTRTSVINWERGHTRPLRVLLGLLADATGVDPDWLASDDPRTANLHSVPDRPAGLSAQPGHVPIENPITRLRKAIPLTPAQFVALVVAA
ncbi:MAG TPA: helix-turn-helix transcriptional regulator, partial [Jiangellaceae bacterium]|nr:helix-turn-helix transcriptional regulator [Jiangellaceae bacterium]